jgi:hypothetical protein
VTLASAGFLIASVISDLKHSLFSLVFVAFSYPVYFLAVKQRAAENSGPDMSIEPQAGTGAS